MASEAVPAVQLSLADHRVLSSVFPVIRELPELEAYPWRKQLFKRGDRLFKRNKPCERLKLLGYGSVRVEVQNAQERSMLLYRIEPGQLCINSIFSLLNDDSYRYAAIAETDGWLCYAEKDQFHRWMNDSSQFRYWIMNNIGSRFSQVVDRFAQHAFLPVDARLAGLLIEKMGPDQTIMCKQSELALELGTAREIVSRHLSRWQKAGWLETLRGGIRIIDIEQLVEVAI